MTDLLSRPILRVHTTEPAPKRPLLTSSVLAALAVVAVGLVVPVLFTCGIWFAASAGTLSDAARAGVLAWLVAGGGGLHVGAAGITAVPLGGTLVLGWLLYAGGRWVGSHALVRGARDLALGAAVMAGVYAACATICAALVGVGGAHGDPPRTLVAALVLGVAASGLGITRSAALWSDLVRPVPPGVRAVLLGGSAAALALLAAAALLLVSSLAVHFPAAVTLADSMHAGVVGGLALALVGAAAVPNAVLCAGAFLVGPGFSVGTATTVAPDRVHLGSMPDFPLLAALPQTTGAWWQWALMGTPVAAGAIGAAVVWRRCPRVGLPEAVTRASLGGVTGGLLFGGCAWLGTGAVGPGRMSQVGPDVLGTTVLGVGAMLFGAATAAVVLHWGAPAVRRRGLPGPLRRRAR